MISTIKARRMLTRGCIGYLGSIVDTMKNVKIDLFNVHVVYKFLDAFPEDLLRLPLDREIEFEK